MLVGAYPNRLKACTVENVALPGTSLKGMNTYASSIFSILNFFVKDFLRPLWWGLKAGKLTVNIGVKM